MSQNPPSSPLFGPPVDRSVSNSYNPDRNCVTIDLAVRALSPASQPVLDEAVQYLQSAVDRGAVDSYNVFILGDRFDPRAAIAHTPTGQRIAQYVREIRQWAEKEGVSVGPYFEEEEVDCEMSGERYYQVQFPTLSLREYHGDELAFVAPVEIEGQRVDVIDRLEALLEAGRVPEPPVPE
jgi:hypothetical protein